MSVNHEERRSEKGFTLIELIVVVVILGLLAGVIGISVSKRFGQAKDQITKMQISELEQALDLFKFNVGRYPATGEGLDALVRNPGNLDSWGNEPYLKKDVPKDPWGRTYIYRCPGTHGEYDLFSVGADGIEGNEDDICSWK